jgi:hypothetical protein
MKLKKFLSHRCERIGICAAQKFRTTVRRNELREV